MAKYIIKRTLAAIPMVLIITVICFTLMNLAPYDAIDAMTSPKMPPETVALIKAKYGYDQPVYIQYLRWVDGMLNGNFGYSIVTHQSISTDLAVRLPNTIKLILPAYLLSYALAIVLGLLAGSHKNRWVDKLIDGLSAVGIALPTFWVAMLLIYFLGYRLKLLPIVGMHTIGKEGSVGDFFKHFIMPFSALFLSFLPDAVRYVRSSTITQYSEDYVLVQQAFGASKAEIMFKHVCKNVLLPIITKLGMALPMLVTGAIITETIFGWPGVGPYFVKAIQGMDYPIVMVILVLSSVLVILGNLLSDILYCLTDPRIKDLG
ncbi:MAG: ABC transporter permease [Lachnospiraceae bacterium]|nr:ABC transporter permease [Lachnospiraceae bacterium]